MSQPTLRNEDVTFKSPSKSDVVALYLDGMMRNVGSRWKYEQDGNVFRFLINGEYASDCIEVYDSSTIEIPMSAVDLTPTEIHRLWLGSGSMSTFALSKAMAVITDIEITANSLHQKTAVRARFSYDELSETHYIQCQNVLFVVKVYVDETYMIPNEAVFAYMSNVAEREMDETDIIRLKLDKGLLVIELNGVDFKTMLWPEAFVKVFG